MKINSYLFIRYQFFISVFFLKTFLFLLPSLYIWVLSIATEFHLVIVYWCSISQSVVYDLKCCNLLYLCITFIKITRLKQVPRRLRLINFIFLKWFKTLEIVIIFISKMKLIKIIKIINRNFRCTDLSKFLRFFFYIMLSSDITLFSYFCAITLLPLFMFTFLPKYHWISSSPFFYYASSPSYFFTIEGKSATKNVSKIYLMIFIIL